MRIAPWGIAAVLAVTWLAIGPPTPDLAAQVYRTGLFQREGWTIFDLSWYGGHHMPGYSILFPPLAALLGVRVVGAVAAVVSAALFGRIARRHFGDGARWGAMCFAAGSVADLLIGRLTFALGMTFALAAVLALQCDRRRLGLLLAAGCTLASPVAGLFLALAGIAHWLAARDGPKIGLWLAATALTPAVLLSVLFPEGGSQPFSTFAFAAIVACCALLLALLPRDERVLRAGVLAYLGSTALAFAVASPMGGNASRLGVALAGPLLLCAALSPGIAASRRRLVVTAAIPLVLWQWWAPVRETVKGVGDPSAKLAYFRPLLAFLADRADASPVRVEVPFTRLHWEAVHVARSTSLARGWETQLDVKYNGLFRADDQPALTPARYRTWLRREGVHYVALPDVALDPSGRAEAKLIRGGLPFLRRVFSDRHWKVYEVLHTPGLTNGVGRLTRIAPQSFTLRARRPGLTLVRVRYTPYWRITRGTGCVSQASGGWTVVRSLRPGFIRIAATFDPRRILEADKSCSSPPGQP
ncbi:MAG: hypothetical protein QOJ35_2210 [Solirubrobacteraceae bacterium]|jgi:hypothetical protein|nr:hypothetical protein [Solirubrobacteraceae bacterium]